MATTSTGYVASDDFNVLISHVLLNLMKTYKKNCPWINNIITDSYL